MNVQRPDPNLLLARVEAEEAQSRRGHLKIFFGAAAGVGKTFAMLQAAHTQQAAGVDVAVGYVEPHGRSETDALLDGLKVIPPLLVDYHGAQLCEFDLDSALSHHPALLLVDELAHSNPPGFKHTKRWQDIEELLDTGIDVYSTLNIQHLESLNDIVSQITEIVVRETVPDFILERADEVALIDIATGELLQRLMDGKVYVPQQAQEAMHKFFRRGNLIALRELALRSAADRVNNELQSYRHSHAIAQTWPSAERILVCISPGALSTHLVRTAKRMADGLHAEWFAVYVETPAHLHLSQADRDQVVQTLRMAEQSGAKTTTLNGLSVSDEILSYARTQNATKIIVGKPVHSRWRDALLGSVLDDLVRRSGDIDIYVIRGESDPAGKSPLARLPQRITPWWSYVRAVLIVVACTVVAGAMSPYFEPTNLSMVYLLGVVVVAARYGRGASILASFLSIAAFDFFFVPPYLTFAVSDTQYILTFAVMLLVAMIISTLTVRLRQHGELARERERRTASLYSMSREFANSRGIDNLLQVAVQHIGDVFNSHVAIVLPDKNGHLISQEGKDSAPMLGQQEAGVAQWVFDHAQAAGLGTDTLPGSRGLYVPLITPQSTAGVLGVYPKQSGQYFSSDQLHLLETFANQTALAIERTRLVEETEQVRLQIEAERLRNSLLSSVSHDLRTPLASITGAVSSLLDNEGSLDEGKRHELAQVAFEEAQRLNRLLGNLLDMTRLESGGIHIEKEWQPLEEVIGTTLYRMERQMSDHPISTSLPPDLSPVPIDGVLIEQVLVNLLENAARYTPAGTPIELSARPEGNEVVVEVGDRGPGLAPGDEERVFEKFYRGQPAISGGVGLGLSICKAIVEAHGGRISARNRPGGGAVFSFTLPIEGTPPEVKTDD